MSVGEPVHHRGSSVTERQSDLLSGQPALRQRQSGSAAARVGGERDPAAPPLSGLRLQRTPAERHLYRGGPAASADWGGGEYRAEVVAGAGEGPNRRLCSC